MRYMAETTIAEAAETTPEDAPADFLSREEAAWTLDNRGSLTVVLKKKRNTTLSYATFLAAAPSKRCGIGTTVPRPGVQP